MNTEEKSFREGMVTGAAPFEAAFRSQETEIKKVGKHLKSWTDRYGNVVDTMLTDLGDQEKLRLYQLQTNNGLLDIGRHEQELLLCILNTVALIHNGKSDSHELQQTYLSNLQNYLSIVTPQSLPEIIDLKDPIHNIDKKSEERILLQAVMEYLYLGSGNYEFLETDGELINFFSVADDEYITEVQRRIDEQSRAVGLFGLADKYRCMQAAPCDATKPAQAFHIFIAIPKEKKKNQQITLDRQAMALLKASLENRGHICTDWKGDSCDFHIYMDSSDGADIIKKSLQDDANNIIFNQFGCKIYYCKGGSNILLTYEKPEGIENIREEIVAFYRARSTGANSKEILNWEKSIKISGSEPTAKKTREKLDSLAGSVDKFSKDLLQTKPNNKATTTVKHALGATMMAAGKVGHVVGKAAVGVGGAAESATRSNMVYQSNKEFDKKILPQIQRDILCLQLAEFIDSGVIATEDKS